MDINLNEEGIIPSLLCKVSEVSDEQEYNLVNNKKRKRCSENYSTKARKSEGEFATIFKNLEKDKVLFKEYFKMSYDKFMELLDIVTPQIEKKNTTFRTAVAPKERLAVCLRYLASGYSFKRIAADYHLGQSTVHTIINDTCKGIWTALSPKVMPQPTLRTWENIEQGFRTGWDFPNCVGALDGKVIVVQTPKSDEKTFSIVLLALVDNNSKFVVVDVGDFDKISEGGTFSNSMLGKLMNSGMLELPKDKPLSEEGINLPHVFIGDVCFPLRKNLLRPYARGQVNNDKDKKIFNKHLNSACKVSDLAFKQLIHNYQIFQKKLQMKPDNVENLLLATCCLHNFLGEESTGNLDPNLKGLSLCIGNIPHTGGNATSEAMFVRDQFKNYFVTKNNNVQDTRQDG